MKKVIITGVATAIVLIAAINLNFSHGISEAYGKTDFQVKWNETEILYYESGDDYKLIETPLTK